MGLKSAGVLAIAAAIVSLAACGSSANPPGIKAPKVADPYGMVCKSLDAQGYCPGDNPQSPSPEKTDPNGEQCLALGSNGYCPGDPSPAPSPTMVRQTAMIVLSVTGSGYPDVLYDTGNSQDDMGSVSLPWADSVPLDPSALYYALTAQLQGGGSIQDSVSESITTVCSNGVTKTESFPLANGSASGGYAIASAEYTGGGDPGNGYQAESDAGC